jgi:hypothetical protein
MLRANDRGWRVGSSVTRKDEKILVARARADLLDDDAAAEACSN